MHFNSTSSSRVEGAHSMLKRYIKSSTGHIDTVFERIHNAITNQLQQIDVQHARLTIIQSNVWRNVPMFNKVRTRVSGFALEIAFQQYKKLESHSGESTVPLPECRSFLKKTMGIPCAHDMDFLRSFNQKLKLNDFHQQWHVEYTPVFRQTSRVAIPRPESPEYEHPHFRGEELQAYQEELTVRHEADMEAYHEAQERAQLNENVAPVVEVDDMFSAEKIELYKERYTKRFFDY